jgi:hypothetical protein
LHENESLIRHRVNPSTKIPEELKEPYGYLAGALVGAYQSFNTLERLYMDAGVVAVLNRTAPEFFLLLQGLLVDNILLSIARLTDKATTGGRENLTLSTLVQELSNNILLSIAKLTDKATTEGRENLTLSTLVQELSKHKKYFDLRTRLDEKCTRIQKMSDPIRLYRHKLLVHADKVECLNANTKVGKDISIKLIRGMLEQIADFLDTFDHAFTNGGETNYPSVPEDVAGDFIDYLQRNVAKVPEK